LFRVVSEELKMSAYSDKLLKDFYCLPNETVDELYERCAQAWSTYKGVTDYALKERLLGYYHKKWLMPASPVLSNAPDKNGLIKGLPISCFLSYVPDTVKGLIEHSSEIRLLTVMGGGIGGHWSNVRSSESVIGKTGGKPVGVIPHLIGAGNDMLAYRQGKTRKGSYAAYLDISHPDIEEFLVIREDTGDRYRRHKEINIAVNITDAFMKAVIFNSNWDLVDPKTTLVTKTLKARDLFHRLIEMRAKEGEPYIFFIDEANRHLPIKMKEDGLTLNGSNLCIEITLPTSHDKTAVCCLSSGNLEYFNEWHGTQMIQDSIIMLDNVLEYFIENAPPELAKAILSAKEERSIGLGMMGFHSYLQNNSVAIESEEAAALNIKMFSYIQEESVKASVLLGWERGNCKYMERRHSHLIAIAPNANNSLIAETSPSIEPWQDNYHTLDTRAGTTVRKNKALVTLLQKKDMDRPEVWDSIRAREGSVQHLTFLTDQERAVFKTAFEIDQASLIKLAADRQKFICQSQSLNLFYKAEENRGKLESDVLLAWNLGVKSLYYQRSLNPNKTEDMNEKVELVIEKPKDSKFECVGCEG
jgi:ribonucleoside-diphosphate reductase alpha chain